MQALTNMKNVGVAMNEFKSNSKLGNFPDDITADRVVAQHNYMSGLGALQGDTSNDYFRQLLGNESVSESNFYAKVQTPSGGSTVTPNGEIYDGQALTVTSVLPGEDGSTVVAGNAVRFDPESFRGKVLIFTTAQSAKTLELDDNDNLQDTFIPKRRGKDISDQFLILTPDFSGQE